VPSAVAVAEVAYGVIQAVGALPDKILQWDL
jgi:hypothetical protein